MIQRRAILLGFSVALFLGIAVYFRLWAIDHQEESTAGDDLESLRRQFERANMEAMDESAEWRMKYDGEVERNRRAQADLQKVKESLSNAIKRLNMLQKENVSLQKQMQLLKQQVEDEKQQCKCKQ